MQSTEPTRGPRPRMQRIATVALLLAGLALAAPSQARPGHGDHHGRGPGGWIAAHAQVLGIDDATLAEIDKIVETSREQAEAIYDEHRAARDVMHELLDQDDPDLDAVMHQADVIGAIDVRKQKHRITTMLAIRAKLTPEQRSQLREMRDEMPEHHGKHGRHHMRDGESCRPEGPPPPPEEL